MQESNLQPSEANVAIIVPNFARRSQGKRQILFTDLLELARLGCLTSSLFFDPCDFGFTIPHRAGMCSGIIELIVVIILGMFINHRLYKILKIQREIEAHS